MLERADRCYIRRLHAQHHVGLRQRFAAAADEFGAGIHVGLVGEMRVIAEASFDAHLDTRGHKFPAGFRRDGDAPLPGRSLVRDSDHHCHAWLRGPVSAS